MLAQRWHARARGLASLAYAYTLAVRLQKTILCAVVKSAQTPIIVVAVSEALLSWEAYVEAVSVGGTGSAHNDQGHCNAAVRRTVADQVSCCG